VDGQTMGTGPNWASLFVCSKFLIWNFISLFVALITLYFSRREVFTGVWHV
jgi:hypothetical protein